ncbi:pilus assembly protein PilP [Alcanivorax sp. S71-1-4]|uniref:pilus assembly protein PilP n=1 Tax=Alcanivorax sp. S71-1-4 TaxID=1177159 RepID=UPI001357A721|nr:pilus assembly protein PilP [Alcanivorax sp. S71-1-4]
MKRVLMTLRPLLLIAPALLALAGCSDSANLSELDARIAEIKARPRGRIEPPPEFKPIATFSYGAHQLRAPFTPPVEEVPANVPQGRKVEPDLSRPREYLEGYTLDALRMVGTINRPGEPLQALVLDPTGAVNRVRVGSYMGRNFGRVTEVNETRVSLMEIVPDGHDGWVERPRAVTLSE